MRSLFSTLAAAVLFFVLGDAEAGGRYDTDAYERGAAFHQVRHSHRPHRRGTARTRVRVPHSHFSRPEVVIGQPPIPPEYGSPRSGPLHVAPRHHAHRVHRRKRHRHRRRIRLGNTPRTKFCRHEIEVHGRGWFKKKYRVKRCVWVRNDLLHRHRGH